MAPADIDERRHDGEPPSAYVARVAAEKATMVGRRVPGTIVLGADTIVVIDGVELVNSSNEISNAIFNILVLSCSPTCRSCFGSAGVDAFHRSGQPIQ